MDFYKEKYLKYKKKYLNLKNLEGGKEERKKFFLGLKKEEDYEDLPVLLNNYLNSDYFKGLSTDDAIKIDIGEYKKVPDSVTKIMLDNIEKLKEKLELLYLENLYSKLLEIFEKNNIEKTVNYFCPFNNAKICKENIRKYIYTSKDQTNFDSNTFVENLDQDKLKKLLGYFKVVIKSTGETENLESYMWRLHSYANEPNEEKFNINDWKSINESRPIKNFIGLLISKYNENKKNQPETTNSYDISKVTKLPDPQTPKFPNSQIPKLQTLVK
jgi:hypothetical protein